MDPSRTRSLRSAPFFPPWFWRAERSGGGGWIRPSARGLEWHVRVIGALEDEAVGERAREHGAAASCLIRCFDFQRSLVKLSPPIPSAALLRSADVAQRLRKTPYWSRIGCNMLKG